ncbi:MAG: hypothetical protein WDW36_000640 [Sanguina aurantia]
MLLSQARPIMRASSLVGTHPTPSVLHPIIFPNETLPGATFANTGNELWDLRDSWVQPSSLPSLQGHWPVCHPDLALLEGTDARPLSPQILLPRSHVQLQLPRPLYVNTGRSFSMGAMQQHPLWHTSNDFAVGAHSYLESRQGQPHPGFPASRPTTKSEPTPLWCVSSMPSIPTSSWEGLPPASVSQHLLSAHGTYCPPVIAAIPNWQSNILPHASSHDFGAEHSAALAAMLAPAPVHPVQSSSIVVPTCTLNLSNTNSPMGSGIHSQLGRSPRMPAARHMSMGQLRGGKLEPGSYGLNQVTAPTHEPEGWPALMAWASHPTHAHSDGGAAPPAAQLLPAPAPAPASHARPSSESGSGKSGKPSLKSLRKLFHMKIEEAAASLKLSLSTLKNSARDAGVKRWPQRKLSSLKGMHAAILADASVDGRKRQALFAQIEMNLEEIMRDPNCGIYPSLEELRQARYKAKYEGTRSAATRGRAKSAPRSGAANSQSSTGASFAEEPSLPHDLFVLPLGTSDMVTLDNDSDPNYTIISVDADSKPGTLSSITAMFRDLGIEVVKAAVDSAGGRISDKFYVTMHTAAGGKVLDKQKIQDVVEVIQTTLRSKTGQGGLRPTFDAAAIKSGGGMGLARQKQRLEALMDTYKQNDVLSIQESIVTHVEYTLARSRVAFDNFECYQAASLSIRDRLIESWNDTQTHFKEQDPKRVYYLSMEFLMGRSLLNSLYNLDIKPQYSEALLELGYDLETVADLERDAALGNGGLGRLAACFLDSMATLNLPAWGYGIRYTYGMFRQTIIDGFQHEQPDYWLTFGNPWEIERLMVAYPIKLYGHVSATMEGGKQVFKWNAGEQVTAVAYDNPIPGFGTRNTINLRLWASRPSKEFDLEAFNTGDYVAAILAKQRAESLSSVLYPDDRTYEGKELRLKQQHFFVSATLQDVLRRFLDMHSDWDAFPQQVAFQLNDTHPTIAVPELMRLLMDDHKLGWTKAWELTTKVFAFTNHTVLPEALERWPVSLMEKLLPRHIQIIYDINYRFLQSVRSHFGDDWSRINRMSIIEEAGGEKFVRMAYLAVVACHTVNGVAAIHSEIIKATIFKDFYEMHPEKFQNKTNGVTQRRWLAFCNPPLRSLLTKTLGSDSWITTLSDLKALSSHADDPAFQAEWSGVKLTAKVRAARMIEDLTGVKVSTSSLFDIQIKRIHEYKRQLLNVLGIIHRYDAIKRMTPEQRRTQVVPRVCVIGGKAAPGYEMAKRIIKLVCAVGDKINNDPDVGDLLKLVFLPDYNVSVAEVIIPGSELSQHISTAGTEASGTSNMKFSMNGCLIIGTLDGANVEIAEEIGQDNIFIFGATADKVPGLRTERAHYKPDARFEHVVGLIRSGTFGWEDYFKPIVDSITGPDFYLVANDFVDYIETQARVDVAFADRSARVDVAYADQACWTRMSIMATAGSGKFSTDRTISEYAKDIWDVKACKVPHNE